MKTSTDHAGLRRLAQATCFSTLLLIFIGGLVKSTNSGLAVPDWPLSYGSLFPPMVGGVFYEHGHRMAASLVGLLMLVLAVWIQKKEERTWMKILGWTAFAAVVAQGILGGLTVKYFLPVSISTAHGTLAQTFFLMTIVIAYSLSVERTVRQTGTPAKTQEFLQCAVLLLALIFVQLILGNVMRHTESGLAIPDFPTMGGYIIPPFNDKMLVAINSWRFAHNYDLVTMPQILIHFLHRAWALLIVIVVIALNLLAFRDMRGHPKTIKTLVLLDIALVIQVCLGIATVLSQKAVYITTFHVTDGAITMGLTMLLILRTAPLQWASFKTLVGFQKLS